MQALQQPAGPSLPLARRASTPNPTSVAMNRDQEVCPDDDDTSSRTFRSRRAHGVLGNGRRGSTLIGGGLIGAAALRNLAQECGSSCSSDSRPPASVLPRARSPVPPARGRGRLAEPGPVVTSSSSQLACGRAASTDPAAASIRRRLHEEVEHAVLDFDQRVTQVEQASSSRLRMLTDQAENLTEGLHAMVAARRIEEERAEREMQMLESNVLYELNKATKWRREFAERSTVRIDECISRCMRDANAQKGMAEVEINRELGDELPRLSAMLEETRTARISVGKRLAAQLEESLQLTQQAVLTQRHARQEAEGTLLRTLDGVRAQLREDIQQERTKREFVQEKLLALLEDSCERIERGMGEVAALV